MNDFIAKVINDLAEVPEVRSAIEVMSIHFGTREYSYKHTSRKSYYMTINGKQVGGVCFSQGEVDAQIRKVKAGKDW